MNDTKYSSQTNSPHNSDTTQTERGSAIIMLFIVVALFGMLAYAFMNSSRTSVGWFEDEQANAAQTSSAECQLAINSAIKRLEMRGCGDMISTLADGSNPNANAPTDGSCSIYHVNGGGVKTCTVVGGADCSTTQPIGTLCSDGTVYAGMSPDGNIEMYTTPSDASGTYAFNNANSTGYTNTTVPNCTSTSPGGGGCTTGEANTTTLATTADADSSVGGIQPHLAAVYCYTLNVYGHDDWYLPAADELNVLYLNRDAGALNGTFNMTGLIPSGLYISSSEHGANSARRHRFSDNYQFANVKENPMSVRCVRKD